MEYPSESLFHGSDILHLDTSLQQRLEEEETYKDQQIRHKELESLLTHAFDDLIDEDESDTNSNISSMDSEVGSRSMSGSVGHTHDGGGDASILTVRSQQYSNNTDPGTLEHLDENEKYRQAGFNSTEQLQVLYEVRVREVQRLTADIEQWKRRAAILEADQDRSKLSLTEHAGLLAAAKGRTSELEAEVGTLKENILNLENSNSLIAKELQLYQTTAADLQSQLALLQRGNGPESFTDSLFRAAHLKHQKEVLILQDQLQAATSKLALKTVECENLMRKVSEITKAQEELLIEKANTIGKLSHSLELSQKQIQQLIGSEEVIKRYGSSELLDNSETDSMIQLGIGGKKLSSSNADDQNTHLKQELKRCIAGYKLKSGEIRSLRSQLQDKETIITSLQDQQTTLLHQIDTFKDDAANIIQELEYRHKKESEMTAEYSQLQQDLDQLQASNMRLKEQMDEITSLQEQNQLQAIDHHSNEFLQFHDLTVSKIRQERNENLEEKIRQLSADLEAALAENDDTKRLYVDLCATKDQLLAELTAFKEERLAYINKYADEIRSAEEQMKTKLENEFRENPRIKELEDECSCLRNEINGLKSQLDENRHDLLQLQAKHENESQQKLKLMSRVNQMEQERNHADSLRAAQSTVENESAEEKHNLQKMFDYQMEVKIKTHSDELEKMKKVFKDEELFYTGKIGALEHRQKEILAELEQNAVKLTEAERNLEVIKIKAEETVKNMKNKLVVVCEDYKIKVIKLKEVEDDFSTFQTNCIEEFNEMRTNYRKAIEKLKCKYKSAKKLALDYKLFSEQKEKHLKSEWQRMENGYNRALLQVQQRMQSLGIQ